MIRATVIALAAAVLGGMILPEVAPAASPLTLKCVRKRADAMKARINQARADFKSERAQCYGPGSECAGKCSDANDACMDPVTDDLTARNAACTAAQRDAIDICRSAQQNGLMTDEQLELCAANARLAGLECKLAATDAIDEDRLACGQTQAACLAACASCGLPSECPQ